jgi:serine protease Do
MTIEAEIAETQAHLGQLPDVLSEASVGVLSAARRGVVQVHSGKRGIGAGVVWDAAGTIITNNHVVASGGDTFQVTFPDGRNFKALVTGRNAALDLAVLKVDASDLPAVPVADSSKLRVGELVFAVGHPLGERDVVTVGIVSGLGTTKVGRRGETAQYIRSDVRLAPGNSGGPLLNARGEVVGINAMIFGGDLSVAIPSHVATQWLDKVTNRRIYLGLEVKPVKISSKETSGEWSKLGGGLKVISVVADGPTAKAGLQAGDILIEVAGKPVADPKTLISLLAQNDSSDTVELKLLRGSNIETARLKMEWRELGA